MIENDYYIGCETRKCRTANRAWVAVTTYLELIDHAPHSVNHKVLRTEFLRLAIARRCVATTITLGQFLKANDGKSQIMVLLDAVSILLIL